jgi:hypothetical protein
MLPLQMLFAQPGMASRSSPTALPFTSQQSSINPAVDSALLNPASAAGTAIVRSFNPSFTCASPRSAAHSTAILSIATNLQTAG